MLYCVAVEASCRRRTRGGTYSLSAGLLMGLALLYKMMSRYSNSSHLLKLPLTLIHSSAPFNSLVFIASPFLSLVQFQRQTLLHLYIYIYSKKAPTSPLNNGRYVFVVATRNMSYVNCVCVFSRESMTIKI